MSARVLQPFRPATLVVLIGLGVLAFVAMAYLMISGADERSERPAAATTTSKSAIGYRGFVELLRRLDLPPVAPTPEHLEEASLRILLAPARAKEVRAALATTTGPIVIVLPKWSAHSASFGDRVTAASLIDAGTVEMMARAVARDIEIVRPPTVAGWKTDDMQGEPTLRSPQLLRSPSLCPLVSTDQGALIARLCARPDVVVLADPDLLANHGLWRGDNAVLAMSMVARLRIDDGPIVALERVVDVPPAPSIWRLAFAPPFVLITLTALVAVAVALWAAATRFGPPATEQPERPSGVMTLIDVTARLLRDRVDGGGLLRRYADLVALDVGRRLRAPQRLQGPDEIGAWLDSSRSGSNTRLRYADLARRVDAISHQSRTEAASVVAAAAQLHRWREELLDGR